MAEQKEKVTKTNDEYSAKNLEVLEGLDAVRMRPGMYIGSTGITGLHHILWEIVDNAIDEAANGFANKVKVTLHTDGSASVEDNGRGIPTDIHPKEKVSGETTLRVLFSSSVFFLGSISCSFKEVWISPHSRKHCSDCTDYTF